MKEINLPVVFLNRSVATQSGIDFVWSWIQYRNSLRAALTITEFHNAAFFSGVIYRCGIFISRGSRYRLAFYPLVINLLTA